MKQMPDFHFDSSLRERPNSSEEWENFLLSTQDALKSSGNDLPLLEQAGTAARILFRLDQAEIYSLKALTKSYQSGSESKILQNLIRLAHVYQWQGEYDKSWALFSQAKSVLNEAEISDFLRAVFHQHLGKLYFDQSFFGLAQAEFATALYLRNSISAPLEQVDSSKLALAESLKRLGYGNSEKFFIRRPLFKDAQGIHEAHMKSIQEICSQDHSEEEINVWGRRPFNEASRIYGMKYTDMWVVESDHGIEGYGQLKLISEAQGKRAYVSALYLTPKVLGRSIGKRIMNLMIDQARILKAKTMTLESTITSKAFYEKNGFSVGRSHDVYPHLWRPSPLLSDENGALNENSSEPYGDPCTFCCERRR